MFILKVFVGVLSIIFAVKIGKDKASNDKEEYLYFNGLVNLCDRFLSDLSYKKSTIDSVLKDNFNSKELTRVSNFLYWCSEKRHQPNTRHLAFDSCC